jgi:hypothetical protein
MSGNLVFSTIKELFITELRLELLKKFSKIRVLTPPTFITIIAPVERGVTIMILKS